MKTILSVALLVCSSVGVMAQVTDLGKIGKTYPIIEVDMIQWMKHNLTMHMKNGEIDKVHQAMKQQAQQYIKRPEGKYLPRATTRRMQALNPIYTVLEDILDADNKILVKSGTQVNPLAVMPLKKKLCFIDGDDPEQVQWMQRHCRQPILNKIILTKGDWVALSHQLSRRLFFDQYGYITSRFNIQALPAVVRQHGSILYVEEFPVF